MASDEIERRSLDNHADDARETTPLLKPAAPSPVYVPYIRLVIAVGVGVFLSGLDVSIVQVSLYTIQNELHAATTATQWVLLSYMAFYTALLPAFGKIGDRYSKRNVFLAGMAIFAVSSTVCAVAPQIAVLIAARAVQGVGAAMMGANGLALIRLFVEPQHAGAAIGMHAAVMSISMALGPCVGGLLTQHFGWPSIFYVNLPFAVAGFFAVLFIVPKTQPDKAVRIDFVSALLLPIAIAAFLLTITFASSGDDFIETRSVFVAATSALGCTALLTTVLFFLRQRTAEAPLFPPQMFGDSRDRRVTAATGLFASLFAFMGYSVLNYLLPNWLQHNLGLSQSSAGLFLMIHPVAMFPMSFVSGWLNNSAGNSASKEGTEAHKTCAQGFLAFARRWQTLIGLALLGAGLVFLGHNFSASYPSARVFVLTGTSTSLMAIGLVLFMVPNDRRIIECAPAMLYGSMGGLATVARTLGVSVGVAISGSIDTAFRFLDVTIDRGNKEPARILDHTYPGATGAAAWCSTGFVVIAAVFLLSQMSALRRLSSRAISAEEAALIEEHAGTVEV